MATVVATIAKERGDRAFTHQLLINPVLDAAFDTVSYQQFATGFDVRRDRVQCASECPAPNTRAHHQRSRCRLFAPKQSCAVPVLSPDGLHGTGPGLLPYVERPP